MAILNNILGDVYPSLHRQDKIYRGGCFGAARVQPGGGIIQEGEGLPVSYLLQPQVHAMSARF